MSSFATKSSLPNPLANTVTEPNYPRNCWWVAARAAEVTRQPKDVWLLDEPVVLYRKENGQAVALDNRCPHRWAPLSAGRLEGDDIACPYHGFKFNPAGQCVHIPSQQQIPGKACVKSYPLVEAGTLIWLWMGDPALADPALVPDVGWHADPNWTSVTGCTRVKANYRLLRENVLDLTHLPHVHTSSIGMNDWIVPPKVTVNEAGHVTYSQTFESAPLIAQLRMPIGASEDRLFERQTSGTVFSPAYHRSRVVLIDHNAAPGERREWNVAVSHITTPISPREFEYFWFFGWDIKLPDAMRKPMYDNVSKAYAEDKQILEAVQQLVERDPRGMNYPEVIVQADQAAIQFRRQLDLRLAMERKES